MKMLKSTLVLAVVVAAVLGEDKKEDVGTVIGIDLGTTYSWSVFS